MKNFNCVVYTELGYVQKRSSIFQYCFVRTRVKGPFGTHTRDRFAVKLHYMFCPGALVFALF